MNSVRRAARARRPLPRQLDGERFHSVVRQRNRLGIEGVGLNDVGSRFEILAVDGLHESGLGQVEEIVEVFDILVPILEALSANTRLIKAVGLDHGAHCAVENDDALAQQPEKGGGEVNRARGCCDSAWGHHNAWPEGCKS